MEPIKLDELQLKIMKVLWSKGEASVIEVQEALRPEREFAITTISTVLQRLHKKDIVSYHKESRQYIYSACVSEEETREFMAGNLVSQLFEGKSSALVNHLLRSSEFDEDELDALQQMIDDAKKKNQG